MNCRQFEKLEMKYMDGEITDAELEQMQQHTEVCEDCRRELEVYREMLVRLQALPVPAADEGFTERVMFAVKHPRGLNRGIAFVVLWCVISAVSSMAGVIKLIGLEHGELTGSMESYRLLSPLTAVIDALAWLDYFLSGIVASIFTAVGRFSDTLTLVTMVAIITSLAVYTFCGKQTGGIRK